MTRAERVDAQLEALYAKVPDVACKGLCTDACGPVDGGIRERARMARAGVRLPSIDEAVRKMASTPDNYECPALKDGRCSTYEVRPAVCRIWGASEDLPCPYGCAPVDGRPLLTSAESQHLLDAARKAGTCEPVRSVAEIEALLNQPGARARLKAFIPTPVPTRPVPPTRRPREKRHL